MNLVRQVVAYKNYFLDFYEELPDNVQAKIEWTLNLIRVMRQIPEKYFNEIGLKPIYEPAGVIIKSNNSAMIVKDAPGNEVSGKSYLPLFSLYSPGKDNKPLFVSLAKKAGKAPEVYDEVRVLVYTQPKLTTIGKKKPDMLEICIGGSLNDANTYANSLLDKEVKISEEEKEEFEKEEEEEITKEGEIMGLTNLEEEQDILEEDIDSSKEELE